MANTKSAKKRIVQDAKKSLRNKIIRSQTQTAIKKYTSAPATNRDEALSLLAIAHRLIDKAASKGVFHRNKSARIKKRLHKHFLATHPLSPPSVSS